MHNNAVVLCEVVLGIESDFASYSARVESREPLRFDRLAAAMSNGFPPARRINEFEGAW